MSGALTAWKTTGVAKGAPEWTLRATIISTNMTWTYWEKAPYLS